MDTWPKRPDGSNKTMGEMTPAERSEQTRIACERLQMELNQPSIQEGLARVIGEQQ